MVLKAVQVNCWNLRNWSPSSLVALSSRSREWSMWSHNFARACHCASQKSSVWISPSCSGGNKPSNTGIAHWTRCQSKQSVLVTMVPTWRTSSKCRAAHWQVSETLEGKRWIAPFPKDEIWWNLLQNPWGVWSNMIHHTAHQGWPPNWFQMLHGVNIKDVWILIWKYPAQTHVIDRL